MVRRPIPWLAKQDGVDGSLAQHVTDFQAVFHKVLDTSFIQDVTFALKCTRGNQLDAGGIQGKALQDPFSDHRGLGPRSHKE
jgi:hypothetical protein